MTTEQTTQSKLEQEGLDVSNIMQWEGRPKRELRRAPPTYWEEYVQTDKWYQRELVRDIPAEEMYAACEDSDFSNDSAGEEDGELSDDNGEEAGENSEEEDIEFLESEQDEEDCSTDDYTDCSTDDRDDD